ncbi:HEAT repeat domain-containing protein [Xanthomonas euvesicatoria]|uniref:HEAT repeat domain-containing protein n=1 Tax=Xanthomonas euvesicatoria TaxID=456327 RepID=UPI001E5FA85A|nr:HEAT repeat domain-containing protein [Xanthomonas euvesicatoria]
MNAYVMVKAMHDQRSYLSDKECFPQLSALAAAADDCVAKGRAEHLTHDCRAWFDSLLLSDDLSRIVVQSLQSVANGDLVHPDWLSKTAEEWVVLETRDYSLRLVARKPRPAPLLQSLNFNCLVGNMSGQEFSIARYYFPPDSKIDEFKVGLQASENGRVILARGQSVELLASQDIPKIDIRIPTLTLTLYPKVYAPLIWCFDKASLKSVMALASHDSPVRRQAGASMLQHIHQSETLPVEASLATLSKLVLDSSHFVRWAAIQGLCAIDLEYARPHLLRAANDPHSSIASAAQRAIKTYLN